jgi:hypothetical protein
LLNLPAKAVPIYNLPAFSENVTVTRNVTKGEGMLKIASNKSGQKTTAGWTRPNSMSSLCLARPAIRLEL